MKLLISLACAATCLVNASAASAAVLNFDDLTGDGPLPALYGGIDWSASTWTYFGVEQAPYTAHSGDVRLAAGFLEADESTTISFAQPATFEGAWFSGYAEATVSFKLYFQGSLVASSSTLNPDSTPAFLSSGYAGLVDKVMVVSPNQGFYAMDDLSFTQAVPEPQTLALLLAGLGCVGLVARRRQRR